MDLSNLNLGELRLRLNAIDKNAAPHEALELSNEIGRRTADQAEEPDEASIRQATVKAVQRSPWFVLGGILVFGITSHFHPLDDIFVLATVIAGIVSGLGLIRMLETQKKRFLILCWNPDSDCLALYRDFLNTPDSIHGPLRQHFGNSHFCAP